MNMRRFIFFLIVCEFFSLACIAANKTIKGHVVDEFGKNVEFASVYVDSIYAVSDKEGKFSLVVPLLVCVVIGTIAFSVVSILVGKIFGYSWQMSVAIGSSCLFGFPGTVIISNEVSESTGANAEEKAAINAEIMPKMLVAGMVTVSITSVLVAGVMSAWL